ncbi:MAG: hypothetical protein KDK39_02460 [Leptospiraceae bacterium]|nr:hypothetical protein [Leptospiraceae bacterium]
MKRTEIDRIEREIKRKEKKDKTLADSGVRNGSVGDYINQLHAAFLFDHNEIFNISSDEGILEILEEMKEALPEKKWVDVFRKAVKKTGIKEKDKAVSELESML